jgi:hypothetical protein
MTEFALFAVGYTQACMMTQYPLCVCCGIVVMPTARIARVARTTTRDPCHAIRLQGFSLYHYRLLSTFTSKVISPVIFRVAELGAYMTPSAAVATRIIRIGLASAMRAASSSRDVRVVMVVRALRIIRVIRIYEVVGESEVPRLFGLLEILGYYNCSGYF